VYRYQDLNADTQIFGLIGDPITHSLSPLIHNRAFRELGINAVYVPFRVPRGELPEFIKGFDRFPVRGYSVTIPHKEAALAVSRQQDVAVPLIGAANTLLRTPEGFSAFNTDYMALRESLLTRIPPSPRAVSSPLEGRPVLILGAGGVGRAAAHALHRETAMVTITNRSLQRAQRLAQEVGCRFVPWEGRHNVSCSVLVNCTSVGMHPNVDEMPVHPSFLTPDMIVFDAVYTPETTLLIKEARNRGCTALTGVDMFVRQAQQQFQIFTGCEAPEGLMQSLAARALSPVALLDDEEEVA
jgi:3-dehydroquinate dehydratase/shikimate dehydrogenase